MNNLGVCFLQNLYLNLDESEDINRFVVGGVLTRNNKVLEDGIYKIRNKVKCIKNRNKAIDKLLNEVKDNLLNGTLSKFRDIFFEEIKQSEDILIIGVYYEKDKTTKFTQELKEKVYIQCVVKIIELILSEFNDPTLTINLTYDDIINIKYDKLNSINTNFHNRLKKEIIQFNNIDEIEFGDSQSCKILQSADLCVGLIRRYLSNDKFDTFNIVKDFCKIGQVNVLCKK